MKFINAETKVTVQLFDDEHEEYITMEMTVEKVLDSFTEEGCPTIVVGVEPVKHGHWIDLYSRVCCSECGEQFEWRTNYCPECGTKMDEGE